MLFLISSLPLPLLSSPSIPHFFTHLFSFQLTITVTAVFDTNPEDKQVELYGSDGYVCMYVFM